MNPSTKGIKKKKEKVMGYLEERERGCLVTPVDERKFEEAYLKDGRDFLDKEHPGWEGISLIGGEAFFQDEVGNFYNICEEGVGSNKPISRDNKCSIEFGVKIKGNRFSYMLNRYSVKLSKVPKELLGEPIDLADFIRVFGQRLNSNHSLWVSFYKKVGGHPISIKQELVK